MCICLYTCADACVSEEDAEAPFRADVMIVRTVCTEAGT